MEIRGACVSSWQLMLAIGQVIGACVGLGTHSIESTASWRIPIAINLVWVVLLAGALFIIPESRKSTPQQPLLTVQLDGCCTRAKRTKQSEPWSRSTRTLTTTSCSFKNNWPFSTSRGKRRQSLRAVNRNGATCGQTPLKGESYSAQSVSWSRSKSRVSSSSFRTLQPSSPLLDLTTLLSSPS